MKKLKLRHNPMNFNNREDQFPFVHSIQTTDEHRVYSFAPTAKKQFQIVVDFPLDNYGEVKLQVAGEKIKAEVLQSAIKFVERNELQFAEAWESSRDFNPKSNLLEISEKSFQAAAKTE